LRRIDPREQIILETGKEPLTIALSKPLRQVRPAAFLTELVSLDQGSGHECIGLPGDIMSGWTAKKAVSFRV